MWAIAVLGLWFTINSDYRRTFLSTQTGCAFSKSYFLDNDGDDAKRINIFYFNEQHWRSIRDRVKQWVLSMYATWEALKPAWFNAAAKGLIPDDFMPAAALQQTNAQTPGGRRRTVNNSDALRRLSFALGSNPITSDLEAS
jgi:hypothetical protein